MALVSTIEMRFVLVCDSQVALTTLFYRLTSDTEGKNIVISICELFPLSQNADAL